MPAAEQIALISTLISFVSIFLVIIQLQALTNQRKIESLLHIYDINRQIITLGFTVPELWDVLHGKEADPMVERHYLQLWLNQFAVIHSFHERGLFAADMIESLERDIRGFMAQENMQRHWRLYREFYSASFQTFVDDLISPGSEGGQS